VFYSANGVSGWSQQSKLVASDVATDDFFGVYVSIWSNLIVVGAMNDDTTAGSDAGKHLCSDFYYIVMLIKCRLRIRVLLRQWCVWLESAVQAGGLRWRGG
jgi:hypothetical protein